MVAFLVAKYKIVKKKKWHEKREELIACAYAKGRDAGYALAMAEAMDLAAAIVFTCIREPGKVRASVTVAKSLAGQVDWKKEPETTPDQVTYEFFLKH
jgi:hypothetical protein